MTPQRYIASLPEGIAEDHEYTWLVSLYFSKGKRRDGIKTSDCVPAWMYGRGWLQDWVEKDAEVLCWEDQADEQGLHGWMTEVAGGGWGVMVVVVGTSTDARYFPALTFLWG